MEIVQNNSEAMTIINNNSDASSQLPWTVFYQKVEYIQSSGTQWIDTWVYATNNTKFQIKMMPLENQWDVLFWEHPWSDTADYRLFNASWYLYLDFPWWSWSWNRINLNSSYWTINTLKEFECWNFYVKNVWDSSNIISWSTIWSFTTSQTLKLNKWSSNIAKTRCYYIKIWSNSTTQVREMYPCYRKSDWVIWMYDTINKKFYTNSWSWVFTKWPNV